MTDPSAQLSILRAQRDSATDPALRAALAAAIVALEAAAPRRHTQTLSDAAMAGVAVSGDVRGSVVAPLFPAGASGNYIAEVINLYQQAPAAPQADYDAALRRYLDDLYARFSTLDLRGIDEQRPVEIPLAEL